MKKITLFLLCLFSLSAFSQKSSVKGRILEKGTLQPVSFATVYINGTTKGTVTDDLGQYELDNVSFPAEMVDDEPEEPGYEVIPNRG